MSIIRKPLVKLIQRLGKKYVGGNVFRVHVVNAMFTFYAGLIFLKPRIAAWRYQRGSRSLAANLVMNKSDHPQEASTADSITAADEDEDDFDVPEEIEEVLEEVIRALRDKNREVQ